MGDASDQRQAAHPRRGSVAVLYVEPISRARGDQRCVAERGGNVRFARLRAPVRYDDQLPPAQRRELEAWVLEGELAVIAVADDERVEPVRAVAARRQLRCSELDLAGLTSLRDRWFASLRS